MFRKFRNKKAQNTAEYAILIALVIGAVVAMQTYAQRALQGRVRDASIYMRDKTNAEGLGNTSQYEPYYTNTKSSSDRTSGDFSYENGSNGTSNVITNNKVERTEINGVETGI
jgi:hypothetical protein